MAVNDFRLELLTDKTEREVEELLHQYEYVASDHNLDRGLILSLLRENEIANILHLRENGFCRVLTENGKVLGLIAAEKSAWDTEHFGFGVGRIRNIVVSPTLDMKKTLLAREAVMKACLSWMKHEKVKCVLTRVDLDDVLDIITYEQNGFQLADMLLTFYLNVSLSSTVKNPESKGSIKVRSFQKGDDVALMQIARTAFRNDHFHRDSRFPRFKSDELFAKWAHNSCQGAADHVIVATMENERVIGFIACKIEKLEKSNYGVIDLVAVSPQHQGKGVGTILTTEAINWFADRVETVFVGTQANNKASIRTYEKVGFRLFNTELTFHKWLELDAKAQ